MGANERKPPVGRRTKAWLPTGEKAKDLAADAHSRRLRQVGLSALAKEARAQVIALARAGAALSGPSTWDEVYQFAADLHAASPWMRDVSAWIMHQVLAHVDADGCGLAVPSVILAGPPGIGKSHYARRMAELAGAPARLIDVGSGSAAFRVTGTEKGWSTAQGGVPVETILSTHTANPVMIVDEVDKAGSMRTTSGNATSLTTALLPLLDPGTARRFLCPFHRLPFDMCRVIWIMTANDADHFPAPLRDRAKVFQPEERGAHARHDIPELGQQVDVTVRHAAFQMRLDVLQIFRVGAVDIARDVQIEIVARDLGVGDKAGVARDLGLAGVGIGNLVNVALAQAVLVAVLGEAAGGVDHEHRALGAGPGFVEHDDRGGNAGAIEEIGGQADDRLNVAALEDLLAQFGFLVAPEEDAMRQDDRAGAGGPLWSRGYAAGKRNRRSCPAACRDRSVHIWFRWSGQSPKPWQRRADWRRGSRRSVVQFLMT